MIKKILVRIQSTPQKYYFMTQEDKIKYFQVAASICNFGFDDKTIDLLVNLYDLVIEKEGETDLKSIIAIKLANREKFAILAEQAKKEEV